MLVEVVPRDGRDQADEAAAELEARTILAAGGFATSHGSLVPQTSYDSWETFVSFSSSFLPPWMRHDDAAKPAPEYGVLDACL